MNLRDSLAVYCPIQMVRRRSAKTKNTYFLTYLWIFIIFSKKKQKKTNKISCTHALGSIGFINTFSALPHDFYHLIVALDSSVIDHRDNSNRHIGPHYVRVRHTKEYHERHHVTLSKPDWKNKQM